MEVINENLQISSFHIAELNAETVQKILTDWNGEDIIGTMSMYFDNTTGALFLNEEHQNYEENRFIAESYLGSSYEARSRMMAECSGAVKDVMKVLEECYQVRRTHRETETLMHTRYKDLTGISLLQKRVLAWIQEEHSGAFAIRMAFTYGKIVGKRMERAKKAKRA